MASAPAGSPCTPRSRPTPRSRRPAGSRAWEADALRKIAVDPVTLAARTDHLAELLAADTAAGYTPALVVASVGATGTGAVDPVAELAERPAGTAPGSTWTPPGPASRRSAPSTATSTPVSNRPTLLHEPAQVAAHQLRLRRLLGGRPDGLIDALSILPEYLRNAATESGEVIDYRDWQVPLGRRFRALKLWAVLRWYGAEGLRQHIRRTWSWPPEFAGWVEADDRFELLVPRSLALVTFALEAGDDASRELLRQVNASGEAYLTHTAVHGRYAIRLAIGSVLTERRHVEAVWRLLTGMA